jgi:hypothetical protein
LGFVGSVQKMTTCENIAVILQTFPALSGAKLSRIQNRMRRQAREADIQPCARAYFSVVLAALAAGFFW